MHVLHACFIVILGHNLLPIVSITMIWAISFLSNINYNLADPQALFVKEQKRRAVNIMPPHVKV